MPDFKAMNLTSGGNSTLFREDLYSDRAGGTAGALYDPAQPLTMAELRGGLEGPGAAAPADENYAGGDDSIEPWMVQVGALVVGSSWGSDKWTFQYAKQLALFGDGTVDNKANLRVVHGELSKRLFLPWDAGTVIFGYQGFFRQDATWWDTDEDDEEEWWDVRTTVRGVTKQSMYAKLPFGRDSTDTPSTNPYLDPPGMHAENRWRWVEKTSMMKDVSKGYFPFKVSIGCKILQPDQETAKLLTPTCSAFVIAFR
jgi:hypothetical protein